MQCSNLLNNNCLANNVCTNLVHISNKALEFIQKSHPNVAFFGGNDDIEVPACVIPFDTLAELYKQIDQQ